MKEKHSVYRRGLANSEKREVENKQYEIQIKQEIEPQVEVFERERGAPAIGERRAARVAKE